MIYQTYVDRIQSAIKTEQQTKAFSERYSRELSDMDDTKEKNLPTINKPAENLLQIAREMGYEPGRYCKTGQHPDFAHLEGTDMTERHYITSAFIDIQSSTSLHKKYDDLEVIHIINETILRASIHTCIVFGGYVQRIQGDGLFVYFGGKNIDKQKSVIASLTSTSFITYFVANDLKKIFEEQGIEDIRIRTGIDFGDDLDTLWVNSGVEECAEITTRSLHTSLACKMQGQAYGNCIVVGDNIKSKALLPEELYDAVRNSKGEITKRYIYEDRNKPFYYKQHNFNWSEYLQGLEEEKNKSTSIASPTTNIIFSATPIHLHRDINALKKIADKNKPYFGG